jgi:N-acetylneuraminic acid mutarotase
MGSNWQLCLILISLFSPSMFDSGSATTISWSRGTDLPLPRGGYQAAWFRGGLLIAGGTYWENGKKLWTNEVSFFAPRSNQWSKWSALPHSLAYGNMVQVDQQLYLVGGSDEKSLYNDIYQLQARDWVRIGEAPFKSVYAGAVGTSTHIYFFGGGASVNDLTKATNQAWKFNVTTKEWKSLEAVPGPPRVLHAVTLLGNYIYIFGGSTQQRNHDLINLDDAYRFDIRQEKWTKLKTTPLPTRAWWATTGEDAIYLFGGYSEGFLDQVYRYDPQKDEYHLISRLPLPLCDTKVFFNEGMFYATAGEDKEGSRFRGTLIGAINK